MKRYVALFAAALVVMFTIAQVAQANKSVSRLVTRGCNTAAFQVGQVQQFQAQRLQVVAQPGFSQQYVQQIVTPTVQAFTAPVCVQSQVGVQAFTAPQVYAAPQVQAFTAPQVYAAPQVQAFSAPQMYAPQVQAFSLPQVQAYSAPLAFSSPGVVVQRQRLAVVAPIRQRQRVQVQRSVVRSRGGVNVAVPAAAISVGVGY